MSEVMMKLFGTKKKGGGESRAGKGLGRMFQHGVGTGSSTSCKSVSSTSLKSKEQKLVELTIQTGMKLHELAGLMYQESVLTNLHPDTLKLQAHLRKFNRQIEVVDSIRSLSSCSNLSSLFPEKEAYHRLAEDLQDLTYSRSKINSVQNVPFSNTAITDTEQEQETNNNNNYEKVQSNENRGDSNERIDKTACDNNEGVNNMVEIETEDETDTSPRFPVESPIGTGTSSVNYFSYIPGIQSPQKYSGAEKKNTFEASKDFNEFIPASDSKYSDKLIEDIKVFQPEYSSTTERHQVTKSALDKSKCDESFLDDESLNIRAAFKKAKVRHRLPLDERFRPMHENLAHMEFPLTSTFQELSSTNVATDRTPNNDSLLSGGDFKKDTPWKNRQKSTNESWFEFKERCSYSSIHDVSGGQDSLTRSSPECRGTFMIRDYIEAAERSMKSPFKKSVRFKLSPSNKRESSESSSEEELHFEVDQFPCVNSPRQLQRSHRRYRL